ncbi:hypothetical protein M758_2G069900, partial [Ceratodon purpureus]
LSSLTCLSSCWFSLPLSLSRAVPIFAFFVLETLKEAFLVIRVVKMAKAAAITQANPQNALKRVSVDPSDLKRSASGSGFTRCDKCDTDIAVARVESHDCEQERKTKALISKMTKQAVKKNDDSAKMAKHAVKKGDDSTKGTKRKTDPKAAVKKTKKAKGKDPNAPKRPASGFFVFMETFRKEYKDANPNAKGVAVVGKAGGEKWKQMSEEEKAVYNKEAESRKATYDQAMIDYKNKDSKDDGEVSEDAAEDDDEEADVEDE